MIPQAFHEFPGWIAFVAAIALVLAAYTVAVASAIDFVIRRFAR